MAFDPLDEQDHLFHIQFRDLRDVVVDVTAGLLTRVRSRVSEAERAPPRVSDVIGGGLAELINVFARLWGHDGGSDDG